MVVDVGVVVRTMSLLPAATFTFSDCRPGRRLVYSSHINTQDNAVSNLTSTQLRLARLGLRLTSAEASDGADVDADTITRIERGDSQPRAATVRKLQDFYEIKGAQFAEHGWVRITQDV